MKALHPIAHARCCRNWRSDIAGLFVLAFLYADSLSAEALWRRGIDAELRFQTASAISFYERAVRADPSFIAPRRHSYAATHELFGPQVAADRASAWPAAPAQIQNTTEPASGMITRRASDLEQAGDSHGAQVLLQTTGSLLAHPRDRLAVLAALVQLLDRVGQTGQAQQYRSAIESAVARDPRPGTRYFYMLQTLASNMREDVRYLSAAKIACAHRAYTMCGGSLSNAVAWHIDNGNPQSAIAYGERGLAVLLQGGSSHYIATMQMRLGRAYLKAGNYDKAAQILQLAIHSATGAGSSYIRAESLHNLAHAYEGKSDWSNARRTADAFVSAASGLHDAMKVVSLRDAGLINWDSGHRATARQFFKRMVRLINTNKTDYFWAGEFYEREGNLQLARAYYQQALGGSADTARITSGLVRVLLRLEEKDSAARIAMIHDRASQTPEEVPLLPEVMAAQGSIRDAVVTAEAWARRKEKERNVTGAANAWLQVSELRLREAKPQQAAAAARKAAGLAEKGSLRKQRAQALLFLGRAEMEMNSTGATLTLLQAVAAARPTGDPLLLAQAHTAVANAYAHEASHRAGLSSADSALRYFDAINDRFTDYFDRARFTAQRTQPYQVGLRMLMQHNNSSEMVTWLQRHKKRITNNRLVGARELQLTLQANEVLIDFALMDSALIALVATTSELRVFNINTTAAEITQLVTRLRRPTESRLGKIDWARATFDHRAAQLLYEKTLLPLQSSIGMRTKLLIVPDGVLHFVPFDALVVAEAPRRYVIDAWEVTYLPSSAEVRFRRDTDYSQVGIMQTDAPASADETRAIMKHMGATQLKATEPAAARALQRYQVVHFATHAEANVEQPLSSFLKLEPGAGNDGYFHVAEIAGLRASARLVFLSACETHVGRVYSGMGVMGLAHSFLTAGAHAVIATQWPVGATAAAISDVFYRRLSAGDQPGAALRAAKLAVRRQRSTSDPLHWGAFILVNSSHGN